MYAGNKIIQIRKRDGRIVDFEQEKITKAIFKALQATETGTQEDAENISDIVMKRINEKFHERTIPAVEEIQDMVENCLIEQKFIQAAKAYIIYRDQHAKIRDLDAMINSDQLMEDYLKLNDWRVKENSNMDYSLQGLNNYVASTVSSHYWLNKVYPPNIKDTHVSGDFHIHDLQLLAPYCCGWDFKDILLRGFGGVQGKVQSKPPKHFATALSQLVNFFYTLQGEAAGAQAVSSLDTLVAPFIRYDKLDFESVKQQVQMFLYNINVPTRVGFQTPFTNVTLDLFVPSILANESVIIGGQPQKEKYGEYQQEMDMFNKAFIEVMTEGDKSGRVLSWPIPTFNVTSTWDWDNPIIDQIMGMTAKYGIPYFSNFINSDMSPDDARSMCCRLRLDNRELRKRGGGLFGANPLTGSIGVVTINLPRLGYLSKSKDEFFERLNRLLELARESLRVKRGVLEKFTEGDLYPYSKFYLRKIKENTGVYWRNHFSTIGILGMNEACLNFLKDGIASPQGQEFAVRVMDHIRTQIEQIQVETGEIFNLEATPAEGTTFRFASMDKAKYENILCANEAEYKEGKSPFYTNSTHLPVNYTDDLFEALELQDRLQTKYTGGTVQHLFLGEEVTDIEVVKNLVSKVSNSFKLPYFTLTPTFSVCPSHGYLAGEHTTCDTCHAETEVYSRVVGYLRPVCQWNSGKQTEFCMRKTYKTAG